MTGRDFSNGISGILVQDLPNFVQGPRMFGKRKTPLQNSQPIRPASDGVPLMGDSRRKGYTQFLTFVYSPALTDLFPLPVLGYTQFPTAENQRPEHSKVSYGDSIALSAERIHLSRSASCASQNALSSKIRPGGTKCASRCSSWSN